MSGRLRAARVNGADLARRAIAVAETSDEVFFAAAGDRAELLRALHSLAG
jgi:hypothetical protein